jgi:hypothetical protein
VLEALVATACLSSDLPRSGSSHGDGNAGGTSVGRPAAEGKPPALVHSAQAEDRYLPADVDCYLPLALRKENHSRPFANQE